jgi:hypothetical protein
MPGLPTGRVLQQEQSGQFTPRGARQQGSSACLIGLPRIGLGPVGFGGGCAFSKSQGRAVTGALVIVAGGLFLLVGGVLLASWAGNRSQSVKNATSAVTGKVMAAAKV